MQAITHLLREKSTLLLRASLALVLVWIGGLKFLDPSPVVSLLDASLPFLASAAFVYVLGVFEVIAAGLLIAGKALRVVTVLVAGQFAGTLFIFLIAPAVSFGTAGFPELSLAGEFLLKDIVLLAATLAIFASQPTAPELARAAN